MRDRDASGKTAQCRAERARRVALDDQQMRSRYEQVANGRRDLADVDVRILLSGKPEIDQREPAQAEIRRLQRFMLSGDDQARPKPARGERVGDRREFDGFGPGADHQPDVGDTQTSP